MIHTIKKRPYLAFDAWVMESYEEMWEKQSGDEEPDFSEAEGIKEEDNGTSQYSISMFCNTLDYRSNVMSLFETFLFGVCLGALCAVFFYMGWKLGIQNYLKRAREHVKKYGDKYL